MIFELKSEYNIYIVLIFSKLIRSEVTDYFFNFPSKRTLTGFQITL